MFKMPISGILVPFLSFFTKFYPNNSNFDGIFTQIQKQK